MMKSFYNNFVNIGVCENNKKNKMLSKHKEAIYLNAFCGWLRVCTYGEFVHGRNAFGMLRDALPHDSFEWETWLKERFIPCSNFLFTRAHFYVSTHQQKRAHQYHQSIRNSMHHFRTRASSYTHAHARRLLCCREMYAHNMHTLYTRVWSTHTTHMWFLPQRSRFAFASTHGRTTARTHFIHAYAKRWLIHN